MYLPLKEEWICYYIRYNHNLGLTSIASVESNHSSIKIYGFSRCNDLEQVENATLNQTLDKYRKYKDKVAESITFVRQKYFGKK